MPIVSINYLAVLVAVVANMLIGYVYYARPVLGNTWMKLIGKSPEELKKGAGAAMGWMLLFAVIEAYVLAFFVDYTTAASVGAGAVTGIWIWLGFALPILGGDNVFSGRPRKLLVLQLGYHLISLVVMGAILAAWQ